MNTRSRDYFHFQVKMVKTLQSKFYWNHVGSSSRTPFDYESLDTPVDYITVTVNEKNITFFSLQVVLYQEHVSDTFLRDKDAFAMSNTQTTKWLTFPPLFFNASWYANQPVKTLLS